MELLIVGELFVDFTLAGDGKSCKLRLGGVAHAARGLWAAGVAYSVAAICPRYLWGEAEAFLKAHGCQQVYFVGEVHGAPSVILIRDVAEVGDQGYEDLMRETKRVELLTEIESISRHRRVLIFPGKFDICEIIRHVSADAEVSLDIAYDLEEVEAIGRLKGRVAAIILSTSSLLFLRFGAVDVFELLRLLETLQPQVVLLKENRGGSRLFYGNELENVEEIPAVLGSTANSVGVGDAFSAVMIGLSSLGWVEAAWRGCQVATEYSRSTFIDDIKSEVSNGFQLGLTTLRELGGVSLPWHSRPEFSVYLAGPDFSYIDKPELDRVVESLSYHNFFLRRPVVENGELPQSAGTFELRQTYRLDRQLLEECDAVFAVPLQRDPGTLVELGIGIELGKPVITYDPRRENENTMVVAGSSIYSSDLDSCINGLFSELGRLRSSRK